MAENLKFWMARLAAADAHIKGSPEKWGRMLAIGVVAIGFTILLVSGTCFGADLDKNKALVLASGKGDLEQVKRLLNEGGDVNAKTMFDMTPLISASMHGHTEIVKLLLGKKPDLNAKDENGVTALMMASYQGHGDVVRLLLANGAEVNIRSKKSGTALTAASQKGHAEIVRLLRAYGARE